MRRQITVQALLLAAVLVAGTLFYTLLYQFDNKYTSALPGGYGYNVLQDDPEQVFFLVDG